LAADDAEAGVIQLGGWNKPHRKLRIAWSVGCGVAAALLIVLWVRSYWRWDTLNYCRFGAGSGEGIAMFVFDSDAPLSGWTESSSSYENDVEESAQPLSDRSLAWNSRAGGFAIYIAHWLLIFPIIAIATVPWVSWRFSLRTLLISITFVAVGLGVVVWSMRYFKKHANASYSNPPSYNSTSDVPSL
jgi:MFS family permease